MSSVATEDMSSVATEDMSYLTWVPGWKAFIEHGSQVQGVLSNMVQRFVSSNLSDVRSGPGPTFAIERGSLVPPTAQGSDVAAKCYNPLPPERNNQVKGDNSPRHYEPYSH